MTESITLGGGCFWCIEAVYLRIKGVLSAQSGYAGGSQETANYRAVCSGATGHAEVVRITFDPEQISRDQILEIFWTAHDPTTPNRQGNDVGPQYRSVIFYESEAQKEAAKHSIETVAAQLWPDPVVTEVVMLKAFYPAELEHHHYYDKVGNRNPYCTFVISPKVNKVRKRFQHLLKEG